MVTTLYLHDTGETVIATLTVKDTSGNLQNPATSTNIVVNQIKPVYASKVTSTAMTNDSTGVYHYDIQTAGYDDGDYEVICTATDGTRITIKTAVFNLS